MEVILRKGSKEIIIIKLKDNIELRLDTVKDKLKREIPKMFPPIVVSQKVN